MTMAIVYVIHASLTKVQLKSNNVIRFEAVNALIYSQMGNKFTQKNSHTKSEHLLYTVDHNLESLGESTKKRFYL